MFRTAAEAEGKILDPVKLVPSIYTGRPKTVLSCRFICFIFGAVQFLNMLNALFFAFLCVQFI